MEKKEFIYMMEKMNEVRLFSRSLIIHSTIKNNRTVPRKEAVVKWI